MTRTCERRGCSNEIPREASPRRRFCTDRCRHWERKAARYGAVSVTRGTYARLRAIADFRGVTITALVEAAVAPALA